jgi:hypothetical protein
VSYKRPTEGDTEWRHSTEAVNRHYTREVAGDLILEQFPLGPTTVGTSPHLYEIPPALPPQGQWSIPNAVLDTQNAVVPTVAVAPGLGFDSSFNPVGTDQGGPWQIRVELFDARGNQVDPEALGIKWRVPESTDLSGTIQRPMRPRLAWSTPSRNSMIVTVRVDNNPCAALIDAPTLDGVPGTGAVRRDGLHQQEPDRADAVPGAAAQRLRHLLVRRPARRGFTAGGRPVGHAGHQSGHQSGGAHQLGG